MKLKLVGVLCLILCGLSSFFAFDRYNENAEGVRALNSVTQSEVFGGILEDAKMKPEIPDETKYAAAVAAVSGIAGLLLILKKG